MNGYLKSYPAYCSKDGLEMVVASLGLCGSVPDLPSLTSALAASTEDLLTILYDPVTATVWGADETCDKNPSNALSAYPNAVLALDGDGVWTLFSSTEGYPAGVCDSVVGRQLSREQAIAALAARPEQDFYFAWSQEDDGIAVFAVANRSTATTAIDILMATATTGSHFKVSMEGVTEGRTPISLGAET